MEDIIDKILDKLHAKHGLCMHCGKFNCADKVNTL